MISSYSQRDPGKGKTHKVFHNVFSMLSKLFSILKHILVADPFMFTSIAGNIHRALPRQSSTHRCMNTR